MGEREDDDERRTNEFEVAAMQRLETRIRVRGATPSVASRPSRPRVERGFGFARDTRTRVADIFVEENTGITTLQTVLLFMGGGAGLALGVAVPSFYTQASDASESRPNTQPCFVCEGTGVTVCRFCDGIGTTSMTMGSGEVKTTTCVNCSGESTIVCTTCNGTGIQPRYLDRRDFADDD